MSNGEHKAKAKLAQVERRAQLVARLGELAREQRR
jgi:hypothetical protein